MKFYYPLKKFLITQGFGGNANSYYLDNGLIGHTGVDFVSSFNDSVKFAEDGFVYKIINKNNPDLSKYRCIFQLVADWGDNYIEVSYGHLNQINSCIGSVLCGDVVGSEGNTGNCFVNGKEVTNAEKTAGSTAGTHLHFQTRKVKRTRELISRVENPVYYLSSQMDEKIPYKDDEGYYYEIINYNNGFNGCVAPEFNGYPADASVVMRSLISLYQQLINLMKGRN